MKNGDRHAQIFNDTNSLMKVYRESEKTFDTLRVSLDKRLRGDNLAYQVGNEVKKIADAITLAKTLTRRLQNLFPVTDSVQELQNDLGISVIAYLDQAFESLDNWETKWKEIILSFKSARDWFGPFSEDQAEEVLKLRYLGYSIADIADMLNIKNKTELETMLNKWMCESH